jgi:hypothetical protein
MFCPAYHLTFKASYTTTPASPALIANSIDANPKSGCNAIQDTNPNTIAVWLDGNFPELNINLQSHSLSVNKKKKGFETCAIMNAASPAINPPFK